MMYNYFQSSDKYEAFKKIIFNFDYYYIIYVNIQHYVS